MICNTARIEKIFANTRQAHFSNVKCDENIGFRIEVLLGNAVRIDGDRHDLLRIGLCVDRLAGC